MGDIQIVLAEDQPLTLIGLRSAVAADSGIQVLAECQDRGRLVEAVKRHSPHVLFVSTDMLQEKLDALQHLVSVIRAC
jgi:DNA-binding NarL/FixJ family response regulator